MLTVSMDCRVKPGNDDLAIRRLRVGFAKVTRK